MVQKRFRINLDSVQMGRKVKRSVGGDNLELPYQRGF